MQSGASFWSGTNVPGWSSREICLALQVKYSCTACWTAATSGLHVPLILRAGVKISAAWLAVFVTSGGIYLITKSLPDARYRGLLTAHSLWYKVDEESEVCSNPWHLRDACIAYFECSAVNFTEMLRWLKGRRSMYVILIECCQSQFTVLRISLLD